MPAGHNPITIRRGEPADAAGIARVHVLAWQGAYRGLLPDPLLDNLSAGQRQIWWRQLLARPVDEEIIWIAEGAAGLTGFASAGGNRDPGAAEGTAELMTLYLLPAAWGQGIGYRVFRAVEGDLARLGFHTLTLWVLDGNRRGIDFYERVGFSRDESPGGIKIERMGDIYVRELRYRKPIPPGGDPETPPA